MMLPERNTISDYNSRPVTIQVTGVRAQSVMRRSDYTITVPYARMSTTLQQIHRLGGKILKVTVGDTSVKTAPSSDRASVRFPQLKHKNPRLRERAMRDIAKEPREETIPELMAILSDDNVVYRRAAVQTLGVIGPDAVDALVNGLRESENGTVRASCAKALAAIALKYPEVPFEQESLEALEKGLYDSDPVVKLASVGALSTIGAPALEILIAALQSEDIALGVAAIGALGSIADPKAADALSAIANREDADPYLREGAQSALSQLSHSLR
ncbi:HEAT repeat domain-containing protein [Phormidium sp. CCY1219]|uniref:HEAT repeat domain-containing protein n=1 Tax=Phormidium sp. CCY1219 TaxID=2886104 RepID=UPI002D1F0EA5|nr:HEAT repeat domain-containing protein [Phormidium sp. CCY1219]MEB3828943.1 HEAT repeat domain-containing protein [Phormidium sp. CCY1219]